jgi:hypothetical protein
MVALALGLARLDAVVRAQYVDDRLRRAELGEDVADLVTMLALVPWDSFGGAASLDLDPPLGALGLAFPDASLDLIVDGRLVFLRTGKRAHVEADDLRALLVRLVFARAARATDDAFPDVREIGVYFARHGHLWATPIAPVVEHEAFPQVETWFRDHFERAARAATKAESLRASGESVKPRRSGQAKPPGWVKKKWAPKRDGSVAHEGKAEQKKSGDDAAPRGPTAAPKRSHAPQRPAAPKRTVEREPSEEPARRSAPKPDWRKGSAWRRARGK